MSKPLLKDRVMETTTTTGTGTYTLNGAVTGFQTFAAVGNGAVVRYSAWEVDANGVDSGGWECGTGVYSTTGPTLTRAGINASSNGGAAVNWGAGTRRIAAVLPASLIVTTDTPGATSDAPTFSSLVVSGTTQLGTITKTTPGWHGLLHDDLGVYGVEVESRWDLRRTRSHQDARVYGMAVTSRDIGLNRTDEIGPSQWSPGYQSNGYFARMQDDPAVVNKTITGAANNGSGLIRITATAHGFSTGHHLGVYGVLGTTEANGAWVVTVINANTFDLQGSTFTNAYVSGGTATNRPMMNGIMIDIDLLADRGVSPALTGTAEAGDDVNGVFIVNRSAGGVGKATDGIYFAHNSTFGDNPEWVSLFTSDANAEYGVRLTGIMSSSIGLELVKSVAIAQLFNVPQILKAPVGFVGTSPAEGAQYGAGCVVVGPYEIDVDCVLDIQEGSVMEIL